MQYLPKIYHFDLSFALLTHSKMAALGISDSSSINDTDLIEEMKTNSPSLYLYEARIGLGCCWIIIAILGLVGNSLVILSVILSKKLRTVTNAFVVNLSVADLWTSLSYPWQAVAILSRGSWPLATEGPCYIAAVQFYTGLGAIMEVPSYTHWRS